ncbi:hypothetical protein [Pseudoalteromonas xiamenensis]|uniref:hypothetical protein n=1 Tax=Pseudoalteromonas xiamenensis TaxID=882626 RepID=UPI0035EDB0E1
MFLIKENETTFTIWWKFIGSIVVSIIGVIALVTGTLYIPARDRFLTEQTDPNMFWLLLVFLFLLSALSFWQGSYGIYQKYFRNNGN